MNAPLFPAAARLREILYHDPLTGGIKRRHTARRPPRRCAMREQRSMSERPPDYSSWPRAKQDEWFAKHCGGEPFLGNGHAGAATHDSQAPRIITRRASEITPEPISWIWKYWLARGKLHIIGGVPETGKTTIALSYRGDRFVGRNVARRNARDCRQRSDLDSGG